MTTSSSTATRPAQLEFEFMRSIRPQLSPANLLLNSEPLVDDWPES
jgi:hypothetical protein